MLKPVNMLSFPGRGRTVIWSFAVVVLPVLIYLAVALAVVALIGDAVTSAFVTNAMVAILITVWRARKGVKDSERPRGPDLEPSAGHPLKTPQNRIRTPRWHFWAATGLVFAFLSGQTAALLVTRIVGVDGLNGVQRSLTTTGLFQALAVALVAAPLGEETLIRGLIYPLLRRRTGAIVSITITTAVFAVLHGTLAQIFAVLPLGIFLGVIYEKTQSVWLCVAAHTVFNLAAAVIQPSLITPVSSVPLIIASLVVFIYAVARLWVMDGKTQDVSTDDH